MIVITIRMNEQEEAFFQSYAEQNGHFLSSLMEQALTEKIEDYLDFQVGYEAPKNLSGESGTLKDKMKAKGL